MLFYFIVFFPPFIFFMFEFTFLKLGASYSILRISSNHSDFSHYILKMLVLVPANEKMPSVKIQNYIYGFLSIILSDFPIVFSSIIN